MPLNTKCQITVQKRTEELRWKAHFCIMMDIYVSKMKTTAGPVQTRGRGLNVRGDIMGKEKWKVLCARHFSEELQQTHISNNVHSLPLSFSLLLSICHSHSFFLREVLQVLYSYNRMLFNLELSSLSLLGFVSADPITGETDRQLPLAFQMRLLWPFVIPFRGKGFWLHYVTARAVNRLNIFKQLINAN